MEFLNKFKLIIRNTIFDPIGGGRRREREGTVVQPPPPPPSPPLVTIHREAIVADDDDEVVVLSPASFARAMRNKEPTRMRRPPRDVRVDEASSSRYNLRKRPATGDGRSKSKKQRDATPVITPQAAPPKPPPKEAAFSCPVCMCTLVEATSTNCGHIFCKQCISSALLAQSKCPTCRNKLSMKDTIRVYLPATETS